MVQYWKAMRVPDRLSFEAAEGVTVVPAVVSVRCIKSSYPGTGESGKSLPDIDIWIKTG
jgi:hypothetical protein